jgi:hypothetical protein
LKGFLNTQLGKLTQTAMPASMRGVAGPETHADVSAQSTLPEQLALRPVSDMLDLAAGDTKDSRRGGQAAIEKLAVPEQIADPIERKKIEAIRNEIETRATSGDTESTRVMSEIQTHRDTVKESTSSPTTVTVENRAPSETQTSMNAPQIEEAVKTGVGEALRVQNETAGAQHAVTDSTSKNKTDDDASNETETDEKIDEEENEAESDDDERKSRKRHKKDMDDDNLIDE